MATAENLPAITPARALMWRDGRVEVRPDAVAVEEPLEIRLAGVPVAVTMRTPGDDLDLAAGFLFTEGILHSPGDIAGIAHCETDDPASAGNLVNVNPTDPSALDPAAWGRRFAANSACGVCGKAGIEQVRLETPPLESPISVDSRLLLGLPLTLRDTQRGFGETGGMHAAGLFDVDGRPIVTREDVGRHNAVDKVIGAMVRRGSVPLPDALLFVSSRASFEIVQKALMAGIAIVATVSAPSSLAIDLARETGMTLIGFLRPQHFNVYAGEERLRLS